MSKETEDLYMDVLTDIDIFNDDKADYFQENGDAYNYPYFKDKATEMLKIINRQSELIELLRGKQNGWTIKIKT